MPTITIQQWPAALNVRKGTILDAALDGGVPYPHGCRAGECGNCKTRLLCGEVDHASYYKEALSDAERDQGLVLACRARPKSDVKVAWLGASDSADLPVRRLKADVVRLEQVARDVTKLRLQVRNQPLIFAPGQYARIQFAKLPARSFSMANRPDEAILEFHIRHLPGGLVSGYVSRQLNLNDTVHLEAPFGASYLREQHGGPIVAVGGGTGLAPMLSVVRTALARLPARPIHLYFGARDEADVYAERELAELAAAHPQLHCHIVLSEPSQATPRRTGFVHRALEKDLVDLTGAKVYVAGPPPMVDAVKHAALERGAVLEDIHSDPFTASGDAATEPQASLLQRFAKLFARRALVPVEAGRDGVATL